MAKVSVLMAVFDAEKYVADAIQSVLNQSFIDFELIIVNDGSTDHSKEAIQNFTDQRIKYHENEHNSGIVYTRNKLMELSAGDYLAWLDADDLILSRRIAEQVRFLDENPDFVMIGTWAEIIDENENKTGEIWKLNETPLETKAKLLFTNRFITSSVMMRANRSKTLKFNEELKQAEDYAFWIQLSEKAKVWNLQKVFTQYRIHKNSLTQQKKEELVVCRDKLVLDQVQFYLQRSLDEKEKKLHLSLSNWDIILQPDEINALSRWVISLANEEKLVTHFDKQALCDCLFERYQKRLQRLESYQRSFIKEYRAVQKALQPSSNYERRIKKLVFYVNCQLQKKLINMESFI